MDAQHPCKQHSRIAKMKRKRAASSSGKVKEYEEWHGFEGEQHEEYEEWNGFESDIDDDAMDLDDPRPNSPNRAPNAASMGTDLAFSRGEQDNDEDEYHTDGHSSIPSSSGHSSPEPPIVTRTWASHIDATIHPRNLKTREVLDFKDWPQGVMYGLRDLADCVADGEVAAEFVKRAFEKRREGSRDFVKPSWVAASDVDWAVMLAKRDGYTRKEITVPVKGRFDRFK